MSTIVSIADNGNVVLSVIGTDGEAAEPETVGYESFCAKYTPTSSSVELMADWSAHRPSNFDPYLEFVAKSARYEHLSCDIQPGGDKKNTQLFLDVRFDEMLARCLIELPTK